MAARERLICAAAALRDGGPGQRFEVEIAGERLPAFAIRHRGQVYAYLNRCAHIPVELDEKPGDFFDVTGLYLICAMHGALYDPASGACVGGRCQGRGLTPLAVEERDGQVFLKDPVDV